MLSDRFKNDDKERVKLNKIQLEARKSIKNKLKLGIYKYENIKCICGSEEFELLAEKDRYGLPVSTVICKKCGMIMINPRMNKESYDEFYNSEYRKLYFGYDESEENYYDTSTKRPNEIFNYTRSIFNNSRINVLEIGCSNGYILKPFFENGDEVTGVDLDENCIEYGKKNGLNLIYGNSSILLEKYKGKFDLIIMSHVLEHFVDIQNEIIIAKKLLNKNGFIYIEVPGVKSLVDNYDENDFLHYLQNAHVYNFSLDTLKQFLRLNGFEYVKGDERIHSLFKVTSKIMDKNLMNYYPDIRRFLENLEENKENYKVQYKKYIEEERNRKLNNIKEKIEEFNDESVMIYGTGGHTKMLLDFIGKTRKILGLLDNDNKKIGQEFYGYEIMDIKEVLGITQAIVISSDVYQDVIYDRIKSYQQKGIKILKIY